MQRVTSMPKNDSWIYSLSISLILLRVYYNEIFRVFINNSQGVFSSHNIVFIFAFLIIFFMFILRGLRYHIRYSCTEILWFGVIFFIVYQNQDISNGKFSGTVCYVMAIVCVLMLTQSIYNFDKLIDITKIFTAMHALGTILFWLFPKIYTSLWLPRISILTNDMVYYFTGDYRSGLTTHYSTNGIYLAAGFLAFASFLCDKKKKTSDIVLFVVMLFALLLTTKRAHLLFGILALIGTLFFFRKERAFSRLVKILLILCIGVLILFIIAQFIPELLNTLDRFMNLSEDSNVLGRINLQQIALELWKSNIWFGIGWGGFKYYYAILAGNREELLTSHNDYYGFLAEVGFIGTALFLTVIVLTLIITIRLCEKRRKGIIQLNGNHEKLLFYSLATQLFTIMYGWTGNPFITFICVVPYLLSCGIVYSIGKSYNIIIR